MAQGKPPRRRKVKRFTAPRREAFLEFLAKTGNWTAAAAAVGIDRSTADQRRKRDADFAIRSAEAFAAAERALAGAEDAFGCAGQGEFNVIRRGRGGRTQIVRAGAKRWSKKIEAQFFAALAPCGNVAAAARAVGFTEGCIWTRRRKWPAFRARMEEALDEAEINIEFRLASMGSDVSAAGREEADGGEEGMGTGTSTCPPQLDPLPFDADLALRFLKWREAKRQGREGGRNGRRWARPPRSLDEVQGSILRKLGAIHRHQRAQKLAEGWTEDEQGHLIPPGWVRKDGSEERNGDRC